MKSNWIFPWACSVLGMWKFAYLCNWVSGYWKNGLLAFSNSTVVLGP